MREAGRHGVWGGRLFPWRQAASLSCGRGRLAARPTGPWPVPPRAPRRPGKKSKASCRLFLSSLIPTHGEVGMSEPLATHDHVAGELSAALVFLKRTRAELRTLRKVRVWRERVQVIDVNGDSFELRGVGYADAEVV